MKIAKIDDLNSQIESKRAEVEEISDSLRLLNKPPKYEIAPGQLPFMEQVRSLMASSKDADERKNALISAQRVLDIAQAELDALEAERDRLETEQACKEAIAEIHQATATYNAAAVALLDQGEELRALTMRHSQLLYRSKRSVTFFSNALKTAIGFPIAMENGQVYTRRFYELTREQRAELGLGDHV